ncbi:MAG: ParB/RepB/Spo0J family partition protein [Thermoguttaceae bacterium]
MSREKRLGRGLEALLGKIAAVESTSEKSDAFLREDRSLVDVVEQTSNLSQTPDSPNNQNSGELILSAQQKDNDQAGLKDSKGQSARTVDIMLIDRNPYQPRMEFDATELDSLAESINNHGLLQPIVVRPVKDRFQIIAGERRYRAAVRAGWSEIPVHLIEVEDREMAELALTENLQRKDLNALEKAAAFANYLKIYGGTHEELASRLSLDRSTVTNLMRLLDLPESIQHLIRKGDISQGHARALLPLEIWEQEEAAKRIISENWNVRQTERFVKELTESETARETGVSGWKIVDQEGGRKSTQTGESNLSALEQEFRNQLGVKVKLSEQRNGKGKIVIPFSSHEEFERLYKTICRIQKNRDAV